MVISKRKGQIKDWAANTQFLVSNSAVGKLLLFPGERIIILVMLLPYAKAEAFFLHNFLL